MIRSYTDLDVYKRSYSLALEIHHMTHELPEFERYELGKQLRRAAVSIPANIAEGYSRKSSVADFRRFLIMAIGSSNEVKVMLDLIGDLGYLTGDRHQTLIREFDILGRQLNKLIQNWKSNF